MVVGADDPVLFGEFGHRGEPLAGEAVVGGDDESGRTSSSEQGQGDVVHVDPVPRVVPQERDAQPGYSDCRSLTRSSKRMLRTYRPRSGYWRRKARMTTGRKDAATVGNVPTVEVPRSRPASGARSAWQHQAAQDVAG